MTEVLMKLSKLSMGEKRLIQICVVGMILSLLWLLIIENFVDFNKGTSKGHIQIGRINKLQNDVRIKHADSWSWTQATEDQIVYLGDSVFVGPNSTAQIKLQGQSRYTVQANTLVTFENQDRDLVFNLMDGKIDLDINDNIKVKVGDEILDLKGQNSQIEISAAPVGTEKSTVKVKTGQVTVLSPKLRPTELKKQQVMKLNIQPNPLRKLSSIAKPETLHSSVIAKKNRIKPPVDSKIGGTPIKIVTPETTLNTLPQVKPPSDPSISLLTTQDVKPTPSEIPIVTPESLFAEINTGLPILEMGPKELKYLWKLEDIYTLHQENNQNEKSEITFREQPQQKIKMNYEFKWHSDNPLYAINKTFASWQCPDVQNQEELTFDQDHVLLTEVCLGINLIKISFDQKIWSDSGSFFVTPQFRDPMNLQVQFPQEPLILKPQGVDYELILSTAGRALGFVVQTSPTPDFKLEQSQLKWFTQSKIPLHWNQAGTYYFRFRVVDEFKNISDWSAVQKLEILPPPPPIEVPLAKNITPHELKPKPSVKDFSKLQKRQLAENQSKVQEEVSKVEPPSSVRMVVKGREPLPSEPYRNEMYDRSRVSLMPMVWVMQSTIQAYYKAGLSVSAGLAGRVLKWWNDLGVEGYLRSKIVANLEAGTNSDFYEHELRLHQRFNTGFPYNWLREFKITLFGGYQVYRNSGGYYLKGYNLYKVGTYMEFPVRSRWSLGGEFVYGVARDKSEKKEISGFFNYFFDREMALGCGYRVHFFKAASGESSPDGYLPYLEGYTEAYSALNYFF